ncbi:terminase [Asticcacaulis excentricus]|uniref:Terminase n=1 Tax=Asticcacaulis excentricus TaxID=78587 RepID=A0A3G9G2E0_9CAUL|nr:terminase [Asticcacaulis excentricus]
MPIHIEVWFRAKSGEQSIEDFVRGLECTAWWLQEMDQLDQAILSLCVNRVGRYPEPDDRHTPEHVAAMGWAPAFTGVWGDSNMPVVDSWLYNMAFVEKTFGPGLFLQPPAILEDGTENPRAENLHNLSKIPIKAQYRSYYHQLSANMEEYDTRRLLKLVKAFDRRGQKVHLKYSPARHEVSGLLIDTHQPLIIACDTGDTLKHAAVFMQPTVNGRVRALDEISPKDRQTSLEEFASEIVAKYRMRFGRVRHVQIVCDPAAEAKMSVQGQNREVKITYAQYLAMLTEMDCEKAETNDPGFRKGAVTEFLDLHDGLLIDPEHCPDLVAAMDGGYCYRKVGNKVSPHVEKNDYSHLGEALEYGCLKLKRGVLSAPGGSQSAPDNWAGYDQQPSYSTGY